MLRKAVKPKLLALFIGICTIGIIIVGYLFNAFQYTRSRVKEVIRYGTV